MRPATSGRTVTDSSERRLPTAVIACGIGCNATLTASTATDIGTPPLPATCGAPPGAGAEGARLLVAPNQKPPAAATTTPIAATTPKTVLFIESFEYLARDPFGRRMIDYALPGRLRANQGSRQRRPPCVPC